jgi:hypothetical protein
MASVSNPRISQNQVASQPYEKLKLVKKKMTQTEEEDDGMITIRRNIRISL